MMVTLAHGRKEGQGKRLGKYELGRTLGEGNFGKVKLARDTNSGKLFAVKILEKNKIIDLNNTDQVCFNHCLSRNICFLLCSIIYFHQLQLFKLGSVTIHGF